MSQLFDLHRCQNYFVSKISTKFVKIRNGYCHFIRANHILYPHNTFVKIREIRGQTPYFQSALICEICGHPIFHLSLHKKKEMQLIRPHLH